MKDNDLHNMSPTLIAVQKLSLFAKFNQFWDSLDVQVELVLFCFLN